ncbi:MAG: type II toxin-antitoxin system prevent-host-death family antitoxin [Planctomycetes bacterium]|nr:type II toxin-antitoxin system prevent-host-death family antitoxin [Planctomycetota bacterium]
MKTVNVRDLQKKVRRCMQVAQKERVVVTRHGKPIAIVTGVDGYDWEDLYYATSASFWKMIEERRREKTIPFEEVCRKLKIPLPRKRLKKAR